jgi:sec-independent protein translocase protein TatB
VPDIGLGELVVIAAIAVLVFGDRLPKVAADAARALRQVRQIATAARKDLSDAAGLGSDPELSSAVRDLRDLDPRRVLEPLEDPAPTGAGSGAGAGSGSPRASAAPRAAGSSAAAPAERADRSAPGSPETSDAGGRPPLDRPPVDPDWT